MKKILIFLIIVAGIMPFVHGETIEKSLIDSNFFIPENHMEKNPDGTYAKVKLVIEQYFYPDLNEYSEEQWIQFTPVEGHVYEASRVKPIKRTKAGSPSCNWFYNVELRDKDLTVGRIEFVSFKIKAACKGHANNLSLWEPLETADWYWEKEVQSPETKILLPKTSTTIQVGETLLFSGTASDDGEIVEYNWDFDGAYPDVNSKTPGEITFDKAGIYDVRFTATDDEGLTTQKLVRITVKGLDEPLVDLNAEPASGSFPLTVVFTGSCDGQGGTLETCKIDFGDGETQTIPRKQVDLTKILGQAEETLDDSRDVNVTHTYNSAGTFTAKLTGLNSSQNESFVELQITTSFGLASLAQHSDILMLIGGAIVLLVLGVIGGFFAFKKFGGGKKHPLTYKK